MPENWAAVAADVDAGLREVGSVVTLQQPATDGSFDPATETTSGASPPVTHEAFGVRGKPYSAFSISTGLVEAKDVRLMLSALKTNGDALPPPVADSWTATFGGVNYAVKRVDATQPDDRPVKFELQLRA